ncbi:MAG: oligosaccharide flippase family protein [Candidatus Marsarchaeota archaeon]|nr:oligosaccharide flippase family protein [Candidatus Marsarchaeota archaeon]
MAYVALGLVFVVLLVRHIGASSFGLWSIASGMAAIAGIRTTSIHLALERFIPDFQSTGNRAGAFSMLRLVTTLKVTLAMLLGAGLFVLSQTISTVYGEAEIFELLRLFAFWLVADSIASIGRSLLFGLQEFRFRSAMTALQGAINVVTVLVAMATGAGIIFITVGFILSTLLPGALQLIVGLKLLRHIPVSSSAEPEQVPSRRVFRYALPLTVNQGLYLLYLNMGRLILGYWLGAQAAEYFSFALNIVERLTGVVVSISSVLLPSLVDLERRSERMLKERLAGKAVRYLSVAGAMFALILFIFSHEATLVMGGEEFLPAVLALQVLAFQPLFRLPSLVLSTFFLVGEDTGLLLLVSVLK